MTDTSQSYGEREIEQRIAKLSEEIELGKRRTLTLLRERAQIERLDFDYAAVIKTLREITLLDPSDARSFIELGDIEVMIDRRWCTPAPT